MMSKAERQQNTRVGTRNGEPRPFQYWDKYHQRYRWRYQIELTPSMSSKRIRVTGSGDTAHEARNKAQMLKRKRLATGLDKGTKDTNKKQTGHSQSITFEQFAKAWVESQRGRIQESTRDGYKSIIDNHLIPAIGKMEMWQIDKNTISTLMHETLPKKPNKDGKQLLGYQRRVLIYRLLKKMFLSAVEEHDLLKKSPVISAHKPAKLVQQPLTKRQLIPERVEVAKKMLDMAYEAREHDTLEFVWLSLMINGLRQGERGGLAWSDIRNLHKKNEATIRITKQLVHEGRGRGNYLKDAVKTEGSYREIPISEMFREGLVLLKEKREIEKSSPDWVKWSDDERIGDLVLLTSKGQPFTQSRDNAKWHAYLKDWVDKYDKSNAESALYKEWTGHVWRKICASLYVNQGVHPEITRRILGHTTAQMTAYYQDLKMEDLRPSVDKVEEIIEMGTRLEAMVEDMQDRAVEYAIEEYKIDNHPEESEMPF